MGCLKLSYNQEEEALEDVSKHFLRVSSKKGVRGKKTTDYYPFGSVLRTAKTNEDTHYRYGYQGSFSEEDEETGWNSFELRMYDPVIGRWLSPDPYGQYWSPYVAMGNNPVNLVDPNGGSTDPVLGDVKGNQIFTEQGWAEMLDNVTVSWSWVDELFYLLNEGGGGIEMYSSGDYYGAPIGHVRNGIASYGIDDPTYGLAVFKYGGKTYKFDGSKGFTKSDIASIKSLLSDVKYLSGKGYDVGSIIESVMQTSDKVHGWGKYKWQVSDRGLQFQDAGDSALVVRELLGKVDTTQVSGGTLKWALKYFNKVPGK